MKKPAIKAPDLAQLQSQGMKRWRQWRRVHAARTLSERRLLVCAGVAVTWFVLDFLLVTPAYKQFNVHRTRAQAAETALRSKQAETTRYGQDLLAMETQLKGELNRLRKSVADQQQALDDAQAGMVPAREMREVLEGLLTRNGQLGLLSMKTLSPDEVRKSGLGVPDVPGLFRHGLEMTVQGSFNDLLSWLKSAEQLPRKLIWSGMHMDTDEQGRLSLTVRLFTISPDPEPLEIAAP